MSITATLHCALPPYFHLLCACPGHGSGGCNVQPARRSALPIALAAFEYVVKSVLYHLTSNRQQRWGLLVLHSLGNSAYVQRVLKGIANVQVRPLAGGRLPWPAN